MNRIKHFLLGFKKGMQNFGKSITAIVNSVLLAIVYFIGVGFASVLAKLLRKHFFETEISEKRNTYWSDLDLKKKPIDEYYRQF